MCNRNPKSAMRNKSLWKAAQGRHRGCGNCQSVPKIAVTPGRATNQTAFYTKIATGVFVCLLRTCCCCSDTFCVVIVAGYVASFLNAVFDAFKMRAFWALLTAVVVLYIHAYFILCFFFRHDSNAIRGVCGIPQMHAAFACMRNKLHSFDHFMGRES